VSLTLVGWLRLPNFGGYFPPPEGISNRDIVTKQWNQGFFRFLTVTIDENVTVTIWTGGGYATKWETKWNRPRQGGRMGGRERKKVTLIWFDLP
jgi:hypothetical protein